MGGRPDKSLNTWPQVMRFLSRRGESLTFVEKYLPYDACRRPRVAALSRGDRRIREASVRGRLEQNAGIQGVSADNFLKPRLACLRPGGWRVGDLLVASPESRGGACLRPGGRRVGRLRSGCAFHPPGGRQAAPLRIDLLVASPESRGGACLRPGGWRVGRLRPGRAFHPPGGSQAAPLRIDLLVARPKSRGGACLRPGGGKAQPFDLPTPFTRSVKCIQS